MYSLIVIPSISLRLFRASLSGTFPSTITNFKSDLKSANISGISTVGMNSYELKMPILVQASVALSLIST